MLGTLVTERERAESDPGNLWSQEESLCFYEASGHFSHPRSAHGLQYYTDYDLTGSAHDTSLIIHRQYTVHPINGIGMIKTFS